MNNSILLSNFNESIFQNEFYLNRIGSTWLTDTLYLFITFPSLIIALILNLIAFYILIKINAKKGVMFNYMRVYCLNSSVIAFITLFTIYAYAPRYFIVANYYMARVMRCKIVYYFISSLLYFGNMLDIIIGMDRLAFFIEKLQFIRKISYLIVCFISLIFSFTVNLTSAFAKVKTDEETIKEIDNLQTFSHCPNETFFQNRIAIILTVVSYLIKNILTLIVEIIINIS